MGEGGAHGEKRIGAINDPAFLALISDQALRRYAITGRPDLGMPDYADKDVTVSLSATATDLRAQETSTSASSMISAGTW